MAENTRWIDHQNGRLGYYLNESGDAVLCDYVGDDEILYLPSYFDDGEDAYDVSALIPDEAFPSCANLKVIAFDCRELCWTIGSFVFHNCAQLQGILDLWSYGDNGDGGLFNRHSGAIVLDDLSFTDRNYAPVSLAVLEMSFSEEMFLRYFPDFIGKLNRDNLAGHLLDAIQGHRGYTEMLFDAFADDRLIQSALQHGSDPESFARIRQCWQSVTPLPKRYERLTKYERTLIENMISWAIKKLGCSAYAGWCLSFIEDALEQSNGIEIFGGCSARESAELYMDGMETDTPCRGSFVFYDCLCQGEAGPINWGHCGICMDSGEVIHAWDVVRCDYYLAIEKLVSSAGDHPRYIGWVPIYRILAQTSDET